MSNQVRWTTLLLTHRKELDLVRRLPSRRTCLLLVPAPNHAYPGRIHHPCSPELVSFKVFSDALTVIYGDPNLEATAVREIRRLHQTGSVAEYAARFESKKTVYELE